MDTVETALYNTLLSGTALDGKHFFYVNPLEVVPEIAENNTSMRHIKTVRQQWFGVACCPPNIARTLESLGNYMYAVDDTTIYSNLFIGSDITADIQGKEVTVSLIHEMEDWNIPSVEQRTVHLRWLSENRDTLRTSVWR